MPSQKFQTPRPYNTASINTVAAGDNTVVAGVPNMRIDIYRIMLTVPAGTVIFKDGTNALSGPMSTSALVLEDQEGSALYTTSPGNGFVINQSGANQLSGTIWYRVAP